MKIAILLISLFMSLGASAQSHNHDIYNSFTHDARPTWYTNLDTVYQGTAATREDTFGCEIATIFKVGGFQIDVTELQDTSSGGHIINLRCNISGSDSKYGTYTTIQQTDFQLYNIGDKHSVNWDADCIGATGLLGQPNKYRWYRIIFKNWLTGTGSESVRVSLLVRG